MSSKDEGKPHAVCVPCPAQGHINPMLQVAKLLHSKGFHITFVHTDYIYNRILSSGNPSSLEGLPDFSFESVPDGIPHSDLDAPVDIPALSHAIRTHFPGTFRSLIGKLNDPSSGVPPVSCIVSDVAAGFTLETAKELGIPDVFLYSTSAVASTALLSCKELVERGLAPLKSEDDLTNGYLDTPVDWIPGLKNMRLWDIPTFIRTTDPNDIILNFLKDAIQETLLGTAIILHTFNDLECSVLEAMSSFLPPMYTIGPLTLLCRQLVDSPVAAIESSFWEKDTSCLSWLEGREPKSVMFLNFGSYTVMTKQQLVEFAWGLANSGHDFIWVIRPDLVKDEPVNLPDEFLAEINGRGLLTSWCPQEEVLQHPAVGGFLTHCGWNSTMESISGGVPMICWPFFGDQQTNCRYLCTEWGIGLEMNSEVKREEVERLIRELMWGEKGMEMRRKVAEWKESAVRATAPGGSSSVNLDRVITEVLLKPK